MLTAQEIREAANKYYESISGSTSVHVTHWASQVGFPCVRGLCLFRTRGHEIPGLPSHIQRRLETGKALHNLAAERFRHWGFLVRENTDRLFSPELQVSGYIDLEISVAGKEFAPVEVKSMQDVVLDGVNKIEDFLFSKKHWLKQYVAQILLYCYIRNKPKGFLYLLGLFADKVIEVPLLEGVTLDYATQVIQNIELANKHIAAGTLPDRIEDLLICKKCLAASICMPEQRLGADDYIVDEELESLLEQREKLKIAADEYEEVDDTVKERIKLFGKKDLIIGQFRCLVDKRHRKAFSVSESDYEAVSIKRLIKKEED